MGTMKYGIRAEVRSERVRIFIVGPMTEVEAFDWKPTSVDKKYYRYFRVAKYPSK